ncbi:MAG: hypothetical protein AAGJ29_11320 [Pseudomonadota bacterium]
MGILSRGPKLDMNRLEQALQPQARTYLRLVPKPANNRRLDRIATWQKCLLHDKYGFRIHGILMDYSDYGARVRFVSHERLPKRLILSVPALSINRPARIVWQFRGDSGLEFV